MFNVGCSVSSFSNELATVFAQVSTNYLPSPTYVQPIATPDTSEAIATGNNTVTYGSAGEIRFWLLLGLLENLWCVPPDVGVHIRTLLAKSRYGVIRTIVVAFVTLNLRLWHAYTATLVTQGVSIPTTNPPAALIRDNLILALTVLDCALVAKLGPFNNLCRGNVIAGAYFGYDKSFGTMSLPLHAKHMLESLGPVIRGGKLQLPQVSFEGGDFIASLVSPFVRGGSSSYKPYQSMCMDTTATALAGVTVMGNAMTSAVFTAGYSYPITPMRHTSFMIDFLTKALNGWGSGANTNVTPLLALFPLDLISMLGDVCNHARVATSDSTQPADNYVGGLAPRDISIGMVASHAELSRIDLARVMQTAFYPTVNSVSYPSQNVGYAYVCKLPSVVRPAALLVEADCSTFAREACNLSISQRGSGAIRTVHGRTVDTTQANPLKKILGPVIAMMAAPLLPPALIFAGARVLEIRAENKKKQALPMQYAAFGEAPPKVQDSLAEVTSDEASFNRLREVYFANRGPSLKDQGFLSAARPMPPAGFSS